ncbi:MAG: C4-dicarboxylate-binding periplasmic protein DctP [Minwuia thermotolerans]|nr:MAG: C4-dicarboxylate-binding periplasmic protein DctP [Minwuia thermotolerans]
MGREMMKRLIRGAVLATTIALAAGTASAEEMVAKFSTHWGPQHPASVQAIKFIDRVNERLKGKLRIDVFPAGQLFGIREIMGALASGSVELGAVVGIVSFPPINRNYNVTAFPGYFSSFEDQRGFFETDPKGKEVWNNILTRTRTAVLAYNPVGPAAIYSSASKLETVASMAGLKARVLTNSDRARWTALDVGKMVSLPTREVYTGLQNGTIDTVSTVPGAIKAYSWWEHLNAVQLPWISFADAYIMANQAWLDRLPEDVRQVLAEEGARLSKEATADIMQASNAVHEEFAAEHGATISVLEGAELAKLRALEASKVEPLLAEEVDADVFAALKAYAARN